MLSPNQQKASFFPLALRFRNVITSNIWHDKSPQHQVIDRSFAIPTCRAHGVKTITRNQRSSTHDFSLLKSHCARKPWRYFIHSMTCLPLHNHILRFLYTASPANLINRGDRGGGVWVRVGPSLFNIKKIFLGKKRKAFSS